MTEGPLQPAKRTLRSQAPPWAPHGAAHSPRGYCPPQRARGPSGLHSGHNYHLSWNLLARIQPSPCLCSSPALPSARAGPAAPPPLGQPKMFLALLIKSPSLSLAWLLPAWVSVTSIWAAGITLLSPLAAHLPPVSTWITPPTFVHLGHPSHP